MWAMACKRLVTLCFCLPGAMKVWRGYSHTRVQRECRSSIERGTKKANKNKSRIPIISRLKRYPRVLPSKPLASTKLSPRVAFWFQAFALVLA